MTRTLQVEVEGPLMLAGIFEDGRLEDLLAADLADPMAPGAIVLARVARVDRAGGAAWLDIGAGRTGFLNLSDPTTEALGGGERLLLQVRRHAAAPTLENKAIELTTDVALPGCFLVHTPRTRRFVASRGVPPPVQQRWAERLGDGWILRSAAIEAGDDEIAAEAERLRGLWRQVEARAAQEVGGLVQPGPLPYQRLLLDAARIDRIEAAGADIADLRRWCRMWMPDAADRIDEEPGTLGDAIDGLTGAQVDLPCGGGLIIEPTHALVAIDVNSGRCPDRSRVNREAVDEAMRQLRLRNLGGLCVIDLLPGASGEVAALMARARALAARDRVRVILPKQPPPFDTLMLTRERRGPALAEALRSARR